MGYWLDERLRAKADLTELAENLAGLAKVNAGASLDRLHAGDKYASVQLIGEATAYQNASVRVLELAKRI